MQPNKNEVVAAPMNYNAGLENAYKIALMDILRPMIQEASQTVMAMYRQQKSEISFATDGITENMNELIERLRVKYKAIFEEQGTRAANKMVKDELRQSRLSLSYVLSRIRQDVNKPNVVRPVEAETEAAARTSEPILNDFAIKGSMVSDQTREVIQAAIVENVNLIKSIPDQYFNRISESVMRAISGNSSIAQLQDEIGHYNGITRRRAQLIATDQTRKAFTNVTLRQMQDLKIKKFKWLHTGGSREPRHYHLATYPIGLNGGIFSMDRPPIIDKRTGVRGFPAQLPNCKCVMAPVVDLDDFL